MVLDDRKRSVRLLKWENYSKAATGDFLYLLGFAPEVWSVVLDAWSYLFANKKM
jgi:hypothetical protein